MSLLEELDRIRDEAVQAFGAAADPKALEQVRVAYLGKKGKLKAAKGRMMEVSAEERPKVGQQAKSAEASILEAFEAAKARMSGSGDGGGASGVEALRKERLDKLATYEAARGSAWGERFPRTQSTDELRAKFPRIEEGQTPDSAQKFGTARLAARVLQRREQSKKLIFLTVQDQTGKFQVALWNKLLDDETLALIRDTLDLWDIVGVEGDLSYTQKGEPTLWATDIRILTKCIAPPPEKHHGLQDKELRYRQRYLDLVTTPESRDTFILRAKVVSGLRRFLDEQGFLEMETPVLQTIPGGAAARPFKTHLNALGIDMFMRIATEIPLKKLLVGGLERVYEIGRLFRNEGIDYNHNPEFTTVEIYQAYGDLRDMMALTETLVSSLAKELTGSTTVTFRDKKIDFKAPWPRLEYCELLKQHAGVAYDDEAGLDAKIREMGEDPAGMTVVDKIDTVFGEFAEPHLQDACFVINQPVEMSPLCKAHPDNPKLADRFEAFAAGMEISNAYSELNDPVEQRLRLVDQLRDEWLKFLKEVDEDGEAKVPTQIANQMKEVFARIEADRHWSLLQDGAAQQVLDNLQREAKSWKRKDYYFEKITRLADPSMMVDEDFLNAMEHGMPPAGGLGIGIDRVVMLLAGAASIRDVILFPLMRPEATAEPKAE